MEENADFHEDDTVMENSDGKSQSSLINQIILRSSIGDNGGTTVAPGEGDPMEISTDNITSSTNSAEINAESKKNPPKRPRRRKYRGNCRVFYLITRGAELIDPEEP